MKKNLFVISLVMLGLLASLGTASLVQADSQMRIGYVNFQEVFESHPAAMEAQEELQQIMQETQMEMQQKMEELEEEGDEQAMQQLQQEFQQDMQQIQQDLIDDARAEVEADIDEIREELDFDLIVNEEGVVSEDETIEKEEITEEVLNRIGE